MWVYRVLLKIAQLLSDIRGGKESRLKPRSSGCHAHGILHSQYESSGGHNPDISTGCRTSTPQLLGHWFLNFPPLDLHLPHPGETSLHSKCLQFLHGSYLWGVFDQTHLGFVEGNAVFPNLCVTWVWWMSGKTETQPQGDTLNTTVIGAAPAGVTEAHFWLPFSHRRPPCPHPNGQDHIRTQC